MQAAAKAARSFGRSLCRHSLRLSMVTPPPPPHTKLESERGSSFAPSFLPPSVRPSASVRPSRKGGDVRQAACWPGPLVFAKRQVSGAATDWKIGTG